MLKQLLILVLCCSWANLFAQEPIRYTTKQGLPTNHVYDIVEDSDGFMWFATKQGVIKYDGETFKTFTIQNGLPNNDTWRLATDNQNRVWYFSKSKYQGYIKNDSVYKFPNTENAVITPRIHHKIRDTLWLYTGLGIFKLKDSVFENNYTIKKLYKKTKSLDSLYPGFLKGYYNLPLNNINISLIDNTLIFTNEKHSKTNTIDLPFSDSITYAFTVLNDTTFFASFKKGYLLVNLKTHQYKIFHFKDLINQNEILDGQIRIRAFKNHFQLSGPGYLLIFDYNWNLKQKHLFNSRELSVWSYLDSQGNIWQNSLKNGITLIPNTQLQSQYYLQNEKVQKIGLYNNQLMAGIQHNGFYQFKKENNNFTIREDIKAIGNIYHIKTDQNTQNQYLVSANYSYLNKNKNNKPLSVPIPNLGGSLLSTKWFKDVVHSKTTLYYATSSYYGSSNIITKKHWAKSKVGLLNLAVYNNKVFASGSDGLWLFHNDSLVKPNIKDELLDVSVNHLSSQDDKLFVGTDGRGVYTYNEKQLFYLQKTDGLSVQRILKDADTLWLATQKGVKKVLLNPEEISQSQIIDTYYESDGLLQNYSNDIYKEGNNLYAASDIGVAKLNLNNPIYKQKPNVYFKTQNDTLNYKNGERDNVSISFALQDYVNQEHVSYQYRLLPMQEDWLQTQTKTLNFNNLSPNLYTLEVKATDQHGNIGVSEQYLNIVPAWWQTWYNKIGFALIGLFTFLLFINKLRSRIRKKEQAKAEQEKRMAGLELQALRSQMNPHFVHNSLNAIQYFIQRNEVELSENYLSKFSQLIRLFFEYSRRQTVTIKEELNLLTNYLDIEKLRFEEKLQYNISVCDNIDIEEQLIPSMLLQPIVENAVNHGLFHKKEQGNVKILFKQLEDSLYQVTVKDDGIGIKKSKHIFKVSSKNYQSNSSKVLHERLDLLNKSNEWHIQYQILDISDIDKSKTGTIVSLTFKQMYG